MHNNLLKYFNSLIEICFLLFGGSGYTIAEGVIFEYLSLTTSNALDNLLVLFLWHKSSDLSRGFFRQSAFMYCVGQCFNSTTLLK